MFTATTALREIKPDAHAEHHNVCLAIIFVIGTKTLTDALMRAKSALTNQPGVDYARTTGNRSSVLAVHYDRKRTTAVNIVQQLRRAGHNAVLVGC